MYDRFLIPSIKLSALVRARVCVCVCVLKIVSALLNSRLFVVLRELGFNLLAATTVFPSPSILFSYYPWTAIHI